MNARPALLALALAAAFAAHAGSPSIAVVNGQAVSVEAFERAFSTTVRKKFYHRAPPESEIGAVRREVAEGLVDRALVLAEAAKREVKVDEDAIRQVLEGYERRYGASPEWPRNRERAIPAIERELREQQQLKALEAEVRAVPEPDEASARAYYESHPALFTEPERIRVSVILLKVDPAAGKAVRDQAREEGREIHAKLLQGGDFADLARLRSTDASAPRGGDLGYLHRGMLGEALHAELDNVAAGEFSAPLDTLEGVAVFKVEAREAAKLRAFDDVRARAGELLRRERSDAAWRDYVAGLRSRAVIETNAELFPPLADAPAAEAAKDEVWAATPPPRGP